MRTGRGRADCSEGTAVTFLPAPSPHRTPASLSDPCRGQSLPRGAWEERGLLKGLQPASRCTQAREGLMPTDNYFLNGLEVAKFQVPADMLSPGGAVM